MSLYIHDDMLSVLMPDPIEVRLQSQLRLKEEVLHTNGIQRQEGRNNSLKLEFEKYLKTEKKKKRKKTTGQLPLAQAASALCEDPV